MNREGERRILEKGGTATGLAFRASPRIAIEYTACICINRLKEHRA